MEKKAAENDSFFEEDETAGWIVTFADLVTLLLVFFVLLYSISSLNLSKFKTAVESIQVNLGETSPAVGLLDIVNHDKQPSHKISLEDITGLRSRESDMLKEIKRFISKKGLEDSVIVHAEGGKIILQIRGQVLFNSGDADLLPTASGMIDDIIEILDEYSEFKINIKGHTDDVPISTPRFPSNWELSAFRATTVLKRLVQGGIDPTRMTATGYGALMPLVPNTSEENRAKNRRVEFVLEKQKEEF